MPTIKELQEAGFSDEEISGWASKERATLSAAGFSAEEIDKEFGVVPEAPPINPAPAGLVDRSIETLASVGRAAARVDDAWKLGLTEGFGDRPLGLTSKAWQEGKEAGLFRDGDKFRPFGLFNETVIGAGAIIGDTVLRTINAALTGAGHALGQLEGEVRAPGEFQNADDPRLTKIKNEFTEFLQIATLKLGDGAPIAPKRAPVFMTKEGELARLTIGKDGKVGADVIGPPPVPKTFDDAAALINPKGDRTATVAKLKEDWETRGIHPAEQVRDAETDAFLRHDLSSAAAEPTLPPVDLVSRDVQPTPAAGRLSEAITSLGTQLTDIGRDAQMLLSPMTAGNQASMAIAKDFANTLRRNRWEWLRVDTDVAKRFTPEQRKRMWDAADEESVAIQLGESREHQGLITLEPAERAMVEELQTRAQVAWAKARDLGMVEGEGLPAYTPRMILNAVRDGRPDGPVPLNGIGQNLHVTSKGMKERKYLMAEETEAAAKAKYGDQAVLARDIRALPLATARLEEAIAGRTLINNIKEYGNRTGAEQVIEGTIPAGSDGKWFTMDHPAFYTWRPRVERIEGGGTVNVTDAAGGVIFEKVPIYVRSEFEGPLKAVLSQKSGPIYNAAMELKGKVMSLIMNSPLIHNAVEWGRALPAMPGKVATFKVYFEGNRAKNDVALMREAIDNGLVPIGNRFFKQDINSIMEAPDLTPGRSLTSKILAFVPGLFDDAAGIAVKRAIDKAGDFWHNTLLWDRVADLQMGLYVNFRADLVAKGVDATTASRTAAHFANRFAGSLPLEAMSHGARKVANSLLFSRTFTMGNLGVMKDMLTGLPKDVLAQIGRDVEGGVVPGGALSKAKSIATRRAIGIVVADMVLMYVGNSILQSAVNVMMGDHTLDEEMHGYVERFNEQLKQTKEHPLKLVQPFHLLDSLSSTSENEPGKQDRIRIGRTADGTAIYARNPAGRIGEEFVGWMTGPLDMMRRKLGTTARPLWQIMANDKGFGRKVYDPDAEVPKEYLSNAAEIAKLIFMNQLPESQINAGVDLVKGDGDAKLNTMQLLGPILGVTFSKGAPGGETAGEVFHARGKHQYAVDAALPDIRKQILRGDIGGAQERMTELGIPPKLQQFYMKTTMNPVARLSGRTLRDFFNYGTEEQKRRFELQQGRTQ